MRDELLGFWFDDAERSPGCAERRDKVWFESTPGFDREINTRYARLYERAAAGELEAWKGSETGSLALILVLDQLPRNMFRGTARAFATDALAVEVALELIDAARDQALRPLQQLFAYMPLQHAEDSEMQSLSIRKNRQLLEQADPPWRPLFETYFRYAELHADIIARFGRFPHRNRALGRPSSAAEVAYLEAGAERFGQGEPE
ncbi:MAG: DUF924 family protein [Haliangiales bacterium]